MSCFSVLALVETAAAGAVSRSLVEFLLRLLLLVFAAEDNFEDEEVEDFALLLVILVIYRAELTKQTLLILDDRPCLSYRIVVFYGIL